ncbi:C-C chemokine receptor type 4-like [Pecten maximus]|uniref:C-C chemokine receptor type 4-like n=1 Tax=Pecten maximus TaxID=6579 RepID=UPI001458168D|nr:C-C chemokine receptor type 4-like [Pecten maximus]
MSCLDDLANTSEVNVEDFSCDLDLSKAELPIVLLLTLVLNILSVIILYKLRHAFQSTDTMMVATLITNDAVTSLIFIVMWLAGWASCGCIMVVDIFFCSAFGWLGTAMVMWSAWIVTIMSASRYLALARPFFYRNHVKTFQLKVAMAITLFITFLQFTGPFYGTAVQYEYYSENKVCAYDFAPGHGEASHRYILLVITIEGFSLIGMVLFFNISIVIKLRRVNVVRPEPTHTRTDTSNIQTKRTAFANVTKVVSAVYCICYAPFLIRLLYDVIDNTPHQNDPRHSITMTLLFMSPLLNPMVYVACNRRYREYIVQTFKKLCKGKETLVSDSSGLGTQTTRA